MKTLLSLFLLAGMMGCASKIEPGMDGKLFDKIQSACRAHKVVCRINCDESQTNYACEAIAERSRGYGQDRWFEFGPNKEIAIDKLIVSLDSAPKDHATTFRMSEIK